MTSCVPIPCVQSGDECCCERNVRSLELLIYLPQARDSITLLLVEVNQPLKCQCWDKECRYHPDGIDLIPINQKGNERHVERKGEGQERPDVPHERESTTGTSDHKGDGVKGAVEDEIRQRCS